MDPDVRIGAEHDIAQALVFATQRHGWRRMAGYWAVASEVSLSPLFDRLNGAIDLYLPAIDACGAMTFRRWSPTEPLVTGPFGISQPPDTAAAVGVDALDAVLLPLLGFDAAGTRLGSGAGFYDRALALRAARAATPVIVGIAYAMQQFDALPRDPWDVPLDAIVTENGWRGFKAL